MENFNETPSSEQEPDTESQAVLIKDCAQILSSNVHPDLEAAVLEIMRGILVKKPTNEGEIEHYELPDGSILVLDHDNGTFSDQDETFHGSLNTLEKAWQ